MTDLIAELAEVAVLSQRADQGRWRMWATQLRSGPEDDAGLDKSKLIADFAGARTHNLSFVQALVKLYRTHHAEIAEAVKLAKWYRGLRDSDPDNGEPYIARERQDSWGNWKTEWLGGLDADRALDAKHNSAREVGE